ncbi:sugar ABC transporter permease [Paenibacillus thalictri]|uniref:Sugar ABC transporter permease n=1 Tax=Paenibacillus thalictri TaxID=2527873 RepID=A0A4Q9DGG9_9BACL|nr:sugar ABC transporter permease [Paenibacillus thalictri]
MVKGRLKGRRLWQSRYWRKHYSLYLMSLPGIVFLLIIKFVPLYGLTLAFKDFNIFVGNGVLDSIVKSPWVGMKHFQAIFTKPDFLRVISNTLIISIYKLVLLFPLPIILAVLLGEVKSNGFKRTVQTLVYLPHFLSWVVVFGLFYSMLGTYGIVNQLVAGLGFEPIKFFTNPDLFRGLLVVSDGWKEMGWSAIVFLAAITSIDPQQYEAAMIDGANRWQKMLHITLPGMMPIIALMLILRVGHILNAGFEQVLAMYNPSVYSVGDIIQTYIYRIGLGRMDYSIATTLGLFESVIALILIATCNTICKKTLGRSIW